MRRARASVGRAVLSLAITGAAGWLFFTRRGAGSQPAGRDTVDAPPGHPAALEARVAALEDRLNAAAAGFSMPPPPREGPLAR